MVKLNKNSVAASFCQSEMKMEISKKKKIKIPTAGEYDLNNTISSRSREGGHNQFLKK